MEYNTGDPSETHTCAVCGTAHDLRQPCPHWALDERITTLEAELARLRPLAEAADLLSADEAWDAAMVVADCALPGGKYFRVLSKLEAYAEAREKASER